ncbi:MAG TPA: Smr/MutS family protein [Caulobacteraceae bacterium]|jgi:DNA-nicking Smr family endonuclease|nr:Smr/MutS family protein [Caulobacteraceae bacterium]
MIRPGPKDARLWAVVAATVRPLPGRSHPEAPTEVAPAPAPAPPAKAERPKRPASAPRRVLSPAARPPAPPETIEPNRLRLIERGREPLAATLDLHGLDQDRARAVLTGFLLRAFDENHRTVLVITGKGALGDGVLRRRTPEWLAEPPLRGVVAGISEAHRARGGAGALYIALKRNPRRGG